MAKQSKDELEAVVHGSVDALIKASADRWTTENLGGVWPKDSWRNMDADGIDDSEQDDWYDGLQDEFKEWQTEATKLVKVVVALSLPLTMSNMELAFAKKLPGQKKAS